VFKISLSDGLAFVGLSLAAILVVLDKSGKLKGAFLLWLLAFAFLMIVPFAVGNTWVSDAPSSALRFTRGLVLVFLLGVSYALFATWISADSAYEAFAKSAPKAASTTKDYSLKPFPGFQVKETEKVTILIGQNYYPIRLQYLKTGTKFTLDRFPISIYLEQGVLCADVLLSRSVFDASIGRWRLADIKINCQDIEFDHLNYDANWTTNAFEVVTTDGLAVLQMIHRGVEDIEINGIFPDGNGNAWYASHNGTYPISADDPKFNTYGLHPLFKYPSWKFPGQYADPSLWNK
jgi:hypothetical protein